MAKKTKTAPTTTTKITPQDIENRLRALQGDVQGKVDDKKSTIATTAAAGGKTVMLDDGVFASTHPDHALAMDGVSCTLCHQIQSEGLGTTESYSGGLLFDETKPTGERAVFGQFAVAESWVTVMQAASGFVPVQAAHTEQSAMCATCHNLFTPYITNDGKVSEELFPEQTPYTEWENSDFAEDQSHAQSEIGEKRRRAEDHIVFGEIKYFADLGKNSQELAVLGQDPLGFSGGSGCIQKRTYILSIHGIHNRRQFLIRYAVTGSNKMVKIIHAGMLPAPQADDIF